MVKLLVLSPYARYEIRSELSRNLPKGVQMPQILLSKELKVDGMDDALKDVDVILADYTSKTRVDRRMLEKVRNLRFVQIPNSNTDGVDVEACTKLGVRVALCPDASDNAVAEHCLAVALTLLRRLFFLHMNTLEGKWEREEATGAISELRGKTWGIIGLNGSGLRLAKLVSSLGVKLHYTQPSRLDSSQERKIHAKYSTFEQLLIESDIISIHSANTQSIIGEEQLRLMKPTALLIDVSGSLAVDETALAKALMNGTIMGASVDSYSEEPVTPQNPLVLAAKEGAPLILTPHVAAETLEARQRIISFSMANIAKLIAGQKPLNIINDV
ncbi:MAG: NAD(P)-dependent oxidoreductase [Conexivisphaerales archaeon]